MIISADKRRKRVTSLFKLATLKLASNHHLLKEIDNISLYYHLLEPVLAKLSKQQLYNLELKDPKLVGMTEDLWHDHLAKRFPDKVTSGDETSRARYLRLEAKQNFKRQEAVARLRLHTKQLERQKSSNQIEVIQHVEQAPITPKLQFKSALLQKINKECSVKEKKFNHDVRFNNLNNNKRKAISTAEVRTAIKRPSLSTVPSSGPVSPSKPSSSMFIPRSKPKILKPTTVPTKSKIPTSPKKPLPKQEETKSPAKALKKSSIFVELAGRRGVRGN